MARELSDEVDIQGRATNNFPIYVELARSPATGEQELFEEMQKNLPGFDNEMFVKAMA